MLSRGGVMTNDGQTVSPGHTSTIVNATMNWLINYKGQAVTINLQSQGTASPLDKILMVYVDNELNSQDVTIAFPDTQQYIGVPAFTTGYYPVLTGGKICTVYNGTSGKLPITAQSITSVIFCNFAVPGFITQETLDITVNSSSGPVVPVIGDQTISYVMNSAFTANPATILPTIVAPLQYVITGIEVNASNLFIDGNPQTTTYILAILLSAPGPSTSFRQFNIAMRPEFENSRFFNICDETGLNFPCQGMSLITLALLADVFVAIPTWAAITVTLTYAEVTL